MLEVTHTGNFELNIRKHPGRKWRLQVGWQRVVSILILVTGGTVCAAIGQSNLAGVLFGAAAGMTVPTKSDNGQH